MRCPGRMLKITGYTPLILQISKWERVLNQLLMLDDGDAARPFFCFHVWVFKSTVLASLHYISQDNPVFV